MSVIAVDGFRPISLQLTSLYSPSRPGAPSMSEAHSVEDGVLRVRREAQVETGEGTGKTRGRDAD